DALLARRVVGGAGRPQADRGGRRGGGGRLGEGLDHVALQHLPALAAAGDGGEIDAVLGREFGGRRRRRHRRLGRRDGRFRLGRRRFGFRSRRFHLRGGHFGFRSRRLGFRR